MERRDDARAMSMAERLALAKLEACVTRGAPIPIVVGDRYVVLDVLGRGGMGEVVRARDRRLDRDVALKCLHAEQAGAWTGAEGASEARALAQLAHPNVVPVFDVVTDPLGVFVVMERIEGVDLRRWAAARPRSWVEILAVMIEAARGLEAVHAAGLVHGDVKPDNVLVGSDGRARIVDFGLARSRPAGGYRRGLDDTDPGIDRDGTERYTIQGTLGYLAPEQYQGAVADACSDRLALCLTLYEILYGMRAVTATTLARARIDARAWALRERPAGSGVPRRVHDVIVRGAWPRRTDRYPGTAALVDALVAARRPRALRRAMLGGLAVAGVAVVVGGATVRDTTAAGADTLPELAATEHRRGLDRARTLASAGRPADARTLALGEAPRLRAAGDPRAALDAERLAADLAVQLGEYAVAERELIAAYHGALALREDDGAFESALSLASLLAHRLARPLDAAVWLRHAAAVVDPRAAIDAARLAVAQADLLMLDARYPDAIARLGAAVDVLEGAGDADRAAIAAARNDLGLALHEAGANDRAIRQYELAAALVVDVYGSDHLELARVLGNLGNALAAVGRRDEAVAAHLRALAIRERTLGTAHPDVAQSLTNLGGIAAAAGRRDEAEDYDLRALAIQERTLGADHPALAVTLNNLANLAEGDDAIAYYQRALAIEERAKGPEHPDVAIVASNLAVALAGVERNDEAIALLERSLAIRERVFGREHEQTAYALHNLGVLDQARGRSEPAIARLEAALRIREKGGDPRLLESTRLALADARTLTSARAR